MESLDSSAVQKRDLELDRIREPQRLPEGDRVITRSDQPLSHHPVNLGAAGLGLADRVGAGRSTVVVTHYHPLVCHRVMVTAQIALKEALRGGFAEAARSHGYKGSAPTWRKSTPAGDWLVVNVQSSSWSTSHSLRCVINISAAPEPWLRWQRHQLGSAMPKTVTESLGLLRDRLHPTGTPPGVDGWWEVSDRATAVEAVADMIVQMDDAGWQRLDDVLTRDGMLNALRAGDLGDMKRENFPVFFARAEALLLMDSGPTERLESCLTTALDGAMPTQRQNAEEFDGWVRSQIELQAKPAGFESGQ